jgi:hypothetical protein
MSSPSSRQETAFTCIHCGQRVEARAYGTHHRNHCPYCLWSRHVDQQPGDRRCACRGPMEPVGIEVRPDGEWAIIHRCRACGQVRFNRIAGDDQELALLQLVLRPLAHPPFPLDQLPTFGPR